MTWIINEATDKQLARLSKRICDSGGRDKEAVAEHRRLCKQHITRIQPDISHIPTSLRYDAAGASVIDRKHRAASADMMQRKFLAQNLDLLRRLQDTCGAAPITTQIIAEATGSTHKTARSRLTRMVNKNLLSRIEDGAYRLTPFACELLDAP